jgi:3-deoxy-D-manno-octulosonic acid (KDO) 8-phosphate synthase
MGFPWSRPTFRELPRQGTAGDRQCYPRRRGAWHDALFLEVHACPDKALCDGPNMVSLDDLPTLLKQAKEIDAIVKR